MRVNKCNRDLSRVTIGIYTAHCCGFQILIAARRWNMRTAAAWRCTHKRSEFDRAKGPGLPSRDLPFSSLGRRLPSSSLFVAESLRLACKGFLTRANFSRAKDLNLFTTGVRTRLSQTSAISDIGRSPTMSQATTDETLCFAADAGTMATPICAPTSEITVERSAAVCETLGTTLAS